MDENFFDVQEHEGQLAEEEHPEPVASPQPEIDLEAAAKRYVEPLQQEVRSLKEQLDPARIEAENRRRAYFEQVAKGKQIFAEALAEGDYRRVLESMGPQHFAYHDAHVQQTQAMQAMAMRMQEREAEMAMRQQIEDEVQQEEAYFYATNPEGHRHLRDFVPMCAKDYASERGPGAQVTMEDVQRARAWMTELFTKAPFHVAAQQMANHVAQRKAIQPPPRRLPTVPTAGRATAPRQPSLLGTRDESLADFFSF